MEVKPIDVAVMTKNSEKYLNEVLEALFKAVKVKRLIVVDHYSGDNTVKIAKKFDAEIHYENVSLGYARQLAINLVETPIFMFLDSDLLFLPPYNWFNKIIERLETQENLASIVMRVSQYHEEVHHTPRAYYHKFWHTKVPQTKKVGFTTGSTFIKKSALEEIKIPSALDAREDRYIEVYMLHKKKLQIEYYLCEGTHFFDHAKEKGSWTGANERILTGLKFFPYLLMRRIVFAPLKAIPPMIVYKNPQILFWNTSLWLDFLKGFLQPEKYRILKRDVGRTEK